MPTPRKKKPRVSRVAALRASLLQQRNAIGRLDHAIQNLEAVQHPGIAVVSEILRRLDDIERASREHAEAIARLSRPWWRKVMGWWP